MLRSMACGSAMTVLVRAYMPPLLRQEGVTPAATPRWSTSSPSRRERKGRTPRAVTCGAAELTGVPGECGSTNWTARDGSEPVRRLPVRVAEGEHLGRTDAV